MKFRFTQDFQFDLLRFTVIDKDGYKALQLYNDSYFTLTEHAVIAYTLKQYYKRKKRVPGKIILTEELLKTFELREFVNNITDEDRKEILSIVSKIYKGVVKDGDEILVQTEKFAQYVDLKNEVESVNLIDYNQYDKFAKKIQKAISPRLQKIEERGSFLVKDIRYRQIVRKERSPIVPFPKPFDGLNRLTNAGGYSRGSVMVFLDRAKKFKTGALVNMACGYLRYPKKILVIDLDNGEEEFMMRVEQCLMGATKLQVLGKEEFLNGKNKPEDLELRTRRQLIKYKALGGEIVVKRMPALITTALDIGGYMDYLYRDFGFRAEILILDYIAKMGCISGKEALHERISEAYIDVDNLAKEKKIEHVWTAQHVNKEGIKLREGKVYQSTDIAGAMDVSKHVHAIYGLNRSVKEEQEGYQRITIVDQRDGPPHGYIVLWADNEKQRLKKLTIREKRKYDKNHGNQEEEGDHSYKGSKHKGDLDAE